MQLSALRNSRLCKRFTGILRLTESYLGDKDIVRKNRIRRGRGTQEGTQKMRYTVPVHQFGFIPALPSAGTLYGPFFNSCGRGQLPLCDIKRPTLFRSPKGLPLKRLKIKGLSVYDTFYSLNPIVLQSIKIYLNPFCLTCGYLATQTGRNTGCHVGFTPR